jgi:hypothetical protein
MAHLRSRRRAAFPCSVLSALVLTSVSGTSAGQETAPSQPLAMPEAQPKTARVADDTDTTKPSDKGSSPGLDLAIGARIFLRGFGYVARPPAAASTYAYYTAYQYSFSPQVTPAVSAGVEWYPGAHFTSGFASNIGLSGGVQCAPSRSSSDYIATITADAYGSTVQVPFSQNRLGISYMYEIGAKVRVPWSAKELGLAIAYGAHASKPDQRPFFLTASPIPDIEYRYIHPRASIRLGLSGRVAFIGGLGYLAILSAADITSDGYFPQASVKGMDIDAGLSIAVAPHIQIRPSVDYRRYFFTFPAGAGVVGVPDDQYVGFNLMLAYRE